jgi:sugar lactone lactonase YvrE
MRAFSPLMRRRPAVLVAVAIVVLALARFGAGADTAVAQTPAPTPTPGPLQFQVEIDTVEDGHTFCEPVDGTTTVALGDTYQVAVCVTNPPAAIAAFVFDLVYDDRLNTAPEVEDVGPALDDNPDANVGATNWLNSITHDDLGGGWDCSGGGEQYPIGDMDPQTGAGHGRARIACVSVGGPWTLGDDETEGVLATVWFTAIGTGADTLHLENVFVGDSAANEIGSCNPGIAVPIPCLDATEHKVTPTPTPAPWPTATPTPIPITSPVAGQYQNPGYDPEDEGQSAVGAPTNNPTGEYETGTGSSLYFADTNNNRIRMIDGDGNIWTVAGNGVATGSIDGEGGNPSDDLGDGGSATTASVNFPRDVFVDDDGNIYIADTDNNRIRVVNTQEGTITIANVSIGAGDIKTVAGTGTPSFNTDGIPATTAYLNAPSGVAVDKAGNIYIADTDNNRVRKVNTGGTITTLAGTGAADYYGDGGPATSAHLNHPHDVYPYGSMYAGTTDLLIADTANNAIRWIHGPSGIINTLPGTSGTGSTRQGQSAAQAQLDGPQAIAADASLDVFIADTNNNLIRRFTFGDATVTTLAGGGDGTGCEANHTPPFYGCPATDAVLDHPAGVAVGSLTFSDSGNAVLSGINPTTGEPAGSFSNAAGCTGGMATVDWAFVVLALGLILARSRVSGLLMRIRSAAGLAPRPGRTG